MRKYWNHYYRFIAVYMLPVFVLFFAAPAQADCTSPAMPDGAIFYNNDFNVMQYCDGTNWVAMSGHAIPTCSDGETLNYSSVNGWECQAAAAPSGTPSGAVMAFDLASCPTGWTAYANGVGRTIVGVGTYPLNADDDGSNASFVYALGATGGRRDHLLTSAEMPSHTHGGKEKDLSSAGTTGAIADNASGSDWQTSSAGGDGAHENRMPYVALLLCKKD